MKTLLLALALCLLSSAAFAAQPTPAGPHSITSVVGKQWPGARFRVDFNEAAIAADPTMTISITFSVSADNKTYKVISTAHIVGGHDITPAGRPSGQDYILNYPVPAGYYARLTVNANKDLIYNMSMGAK